MTPVDTAAAVVLTRAAVFAAAVIDYRAFRVDVAEVRITGNAVKVALHRMENTPGDVDNVDAYLDALDRGHRTVRTTNRLVALATAGTPDR